MSTTQTTISEWFDRGLTDGATHLIVVCDTFDYDDYPVYVSKDEDVKEVFAKYNGQNMQKVMEVYNLSQPKMSQLQAARSFNF